MNAQSFRPSALLAALLLGAAIFPSSLSAQQDSTVVVLVSPTPAVAVAAPVVTLTPALTGGPRILAAGIIKPLGADTDTRALPRRQDTMGNGTNVAMMFVGVGGIVAGSIIGGDSGRVIAVGGAVVGLTGLFRYLR